MKSVAKKNIKVGGGGGAKLKREKMNLKKAIFLRMALAVDKAMVTEKYPIQREKHGNRIAEDRCSIVCKNILESSVVEHFFL